MQFSDGWKEMAPWAQLTWTILITGYVWWANRKTTRAKMIKEIRSAIDERPTREEFGKLEGSIVGLEEKIERRCRSRKRWIVGIEKTTEGLEKELAHLPTQQDLKDIGREMTDLRSELAGLTGRLGGINRAVDLLNEYHISQGTNKGASGP